MSKIQAFFWYQNLRKFEKNLKQSDRAPVKSVTTFGAASIQTMIKKHINADNGIIKSTYKIETFQGFTDDGIKMLDRREINVNLDIENQCMGTFKYPYTDFNMSRLKV